MQDFKKTRAVESISEFVGQVLELQEGAGPDSPGLWFRGQPRGTPQLQPAVLRSWFIDRVAEQSGEGGDSQSTLLELEIALNRAFRRQGASFLPSDSSLVDIYFLAQHHGLPTRLLDWTTNPLAALFFAVIADPDDDGVVLAMVPDWALGGESQSDRRGAPLDVRDERVRCTIARLFGEGTEAMPGVILPVLPDLRAGRMLQQGSCFTLHTPDSQPIPNSIVSRFTIPGGKKRDLEAGLRSLGVNWATLFPDLDHLAREIRGQWNLSPLRDPPTG